MRKIIFDASVLVTAHTAASHHKTGLFRVSHEILKQLVKSESFEIYLFDIFSRERELIKYVQSEFEDCHRIKSYSSIYRFLIFPLGNLSDALRRIEHSGERTLIAQASGFLKNILLLTEKAARKIERLITGKVNAVKSFKGFDLYYSTYFPIPEYVRNNPAIKKVYTLHDVIPIVHPGYFSSSFNSILIREVVDNIKKDDFVICVSESTKRDLLSLRSEIDPQQVHVAYLAAADLFHPVTDQVKILAVKQKYKIPAEKKYLLSVCTFEPRKNLKTLIRAFASLLAGGKANDISLVLTGAPYWDKDPLLDEIDMLNNKYNHPVIITGFVPDADLAVTYSGAYAFVYPSFYEGFGLPPLEAMQCGIPVICSNTSSLPEVVANCGIFTDPGNESDLAEAILSLIENNELRNTLSDESVKRAASFSWERSAKVVMNVFDLAFSSK